MWSKENANVYRQMTFYPYLANFMQTIVMEEFSQRANKM